MAMDYQEMMKTEEGCFKLLFEMKFPGGEFICPDCGHSRAYDLRSRPKKQCTDCGKQISARVGTIFENTRIPLTQAFEIVTEYVRGTRRPGSKNPEKSKVVPSTRWRWCHKLRLKIEQWISRNKTIVVDREFLEAILFRRSAETPARDSDKQHEEPHHKEGLSRCGQNESNAIADIVDFISSTYRGVSEKYIQLYGSEYLFIRESKGLSISAILALFVCAGPVSCSEIERYSSPKYIRLPDPNLLPLNDTSLAAGL